MIEVQRQLVDAVREVPGGLELGDARKVSRALVRLGHLNCERAAKYLLATLVCAFRGRDYSEQRKRDFGALLSDAADLNLDTLAFGLDAALRHGDAHGEFHGTDEGVEFTANKREYDFLTWDELLDRVLGGLESSLAMHTAVTCAAAEAGIDTDDLIDLDSIFTFEDRVAMVAAMDGWTGVEIALEAGRLDIRATTPRRANFTAVAMIGTLLADEITYLAVELVGPSGPQTLEGPVDVLRTFNDLRPGPEKEAEFVDFMRTWNLDGTPIVDRAGVRKVVAFRAMEAASDDWVPLIRRPKAIRPWLDIARRAGDQELAVAVTQLVASVRRAAIGEPVGASYARAAKRLEAWSSVEMDYRLADAS